MDPVRARPPRRARGRPRAAFTAACLALPLLAVASCRARPPGPADGPYPDDVVAREARIRDLYAEAETSLNRRAFEEARDRLRPILTLDPQHPLAYLGLVLIEHRRGDLATADEALGRLAPADGPGRLFGRGTLRFLQGRPQDAEPLYEEALARYRAAASPAGEAASLTGLGNLRFRAARFDEAAAAYALSARIAERLGDERSRADCYSNLGNVAQARGMDDEALAHYRAALEIRTRLQDRKGLAVVHHNMGQILRRRGEGDAARGALEQALAIHRELGDRAGEMRNLTSLGLVDLELGRDREASDALGRSLELARALGDRRAEAAALTGLASVELRAGRPHEALRRHREALALRRAAGDPAGEAASLNNLAAVHEVLGARADALESYAASLALHRSIEDRRGEATLLANLGRLRAESGETEEGLRDLDAAVRLFVSLGDPAGEAGAREELGRALTADGDYEAAEASLERSLALRRDGGDRRGEASCLDALGVLRGRRAEFARARDDLERALGLARDLKDRGLEAAALDHLSGVHLARGDLAEALRLQRQALDIRRVLGDRAREAASLNNLGAIYQTIGDEAAAARYLREALESFRTLSDRAGEALARTNLGVLLEEARDLPAALRQHAEAVRLWEALRDQRGAAHALHNLAAVQAALGRPEEAQRSLERALRAARALGDPGAEAVIQSGLADVLLRRGRHQAAADRYRQALGLADASGMREEIGRAEAGLADCHAAAGRVPEALESYGRAIDALESLRGGLFTGEFKTAFLSRRADLYERPIGLLRRHGVQVPGLDAAARAFEYAERARARSLLDLLAESHADLRAGVPRDLLRREAEAVARVARATRRLRAGAPLERDARARERAEAEEALALIDVEIRRASPRYAQIARPEPIAAGEVRRGLLRDGEILLEYLLGAEASYLWVVTHQGMSWHDLPPRERIESAVRRLLERVRSPASDLGPEAAHLTDAGEVGRMLLPAGIPSEGRVLIVVPDGILHYLPFEVLRQPAGRDPRAEALLLHDYEILYAPSASALRALRRAPAGDPRAPATLLALGDPPVASGPEAARDLPPLPFARDEVLRIGALFRRTRRTVLLGPEAREEAIAAAASERFTYVHFAVHGLIDEEAPGRSGLLLAVDPEGPGDGVLEVNEIFRLRLGADLAVLSACRTGLGRVVRGEGMIGLTRAFLFAGAKGVVVSLWSVGDRSTADFMEDLYRRLVGGTAPRAALRQAKLAFLASDTPALRHPSRWAAFVLVGDPGPAGTP
jgi:tetratricopeptide (TPR) repeat protein